MQKPTILTITDSCRLDKNILEATTRAELYLDEGVTRTIEILEIVKRGKRFNHAYLDTRILDRDTGKYAPGDRRHDTDRKTVEKLLSEWRALPVMDSRRLFVSSTKIETRYLA